MASASAFSKRFAVLVLPLLLATAATAGAASHRAASVRFAAGSKRVVQGNWASVRLAVRPAGVRCSLAVRYHDGSRQANLPSVVASRGVASWKWQVALTSEAGVARVTASCGRAGRATRTLLVVGSLIPARIDVVKQGFSVRARSYGGSSVSYGVILKNTSPNQDALQVTVLVNFVMGDNVLLGSATTTIPVIAAGSTYALGNNLSFPGAAPIARLEVVGQIGARQPRAVMHVPALANLRILPSEYDPGWVGSVEGELINVDPAMIMQNAQLSAVIFDANGAVIGGGTGYAFASLPPGTREFIKLQTGFDAVPILSAAEVWVSVQASFRPPGT